MASGLIDVAATVAALVLVLILFGIASVRADPALVQAAIIVATVVVFVVAPTTLETLTRGRSLGKLALGLRAVRDDAGPISFQHALIRALIGFVEIYTLFGVPAFFSMLVSSRGKRLGDYAAGTYVVRTRVNLALPLPPAMPPHLAAWAARADITVAADRPRARREAVPRPAAGPRPAVARRRRRAAGRRGQRPRGAPAARGTLPEDFLAAVIAARRERDLARLRRQGDFRARLTSRR